MGNLVYKNALAAGAHGLFTDLKTLLTNSFSPTDPRGFGWTLYYSSGDDAIFFSTGASQSERIYLRLTVDPTNNYIDRTIFQVSAADGYNMINDFGDSTTRINVTSGSFEYWIAGNQDFFYLTTLVGTTYAHNYSGLINRFGPTQSSSLYGITAPSPANTTTPTASFTIGTNTALYLRTGLDGYGGYDATNISLVINQRLTIVDQSVGTSTSGNIGVVILNSKNTSNNSIVVSYVSGANTFSSFSMIGIDPQPNALNSNGALFGGGNPILMINDGYGDSMPQFFAIDEENCCVPNGLQDPDIRGIFIAYPIRISNSTELRGTLFGLIETPVGAPGPQDVFITYDGVFKFINFPDGSKFVAMGSII